MTFARRHAVLSLALAFSLLACQAVRADVTLQVNLGGDLALPDGTVGVLVVDRAGDGFLSPDHVSVEGTVLTAGQQIGLSDDLIVGVLQSSSAPFTGGSGFVGVLAGIDYDALQLAEGRKMTFYWFPGITTPGAAVTSLATYESFKADDPGNLADTIEFLLPPDRGVYDIAYLDAANGGNVSITNPGTAGEHSSGTPGADPTPIPSGGDSKVDPVTTLPPPPGMEDIDWLTDAAGIFYGLIVGPGGRIEGEITVKVAPTGAMSAAITLGGARHSYAGALTVPGAELVGALIPRPNTAQPDLILDLMLMENDSTGGYSLVGTLDDDGTPLDITAAHNPAKRGVEVDEAGLYTFAIPAPGSVGQTLLPAGDGVGSISVSSSGAISALINLGDGTRASDKGYLSQDHGWDLYVPLYRGKGDGFLAGSVALREIDNIADFDSPLHWKKGPEPKPSAKSFYPLGFETSANLVGSRFAAPRKGAPILAQLVDGPDNAVLTLEGGDLDPLVGPKTLTWSMLNKVTFDGTADGEKIGIKPSTKNGLVTGSFTKTYLNGNNKKVTQKVAFVGVALQKQGLIVGNFKGNNGLTGLMTIESAGMPDLTVLDDDAIPISNLGSLDFGDTGIDGPGGERIIELVNNGPGNLYIDGPPQLDGAGFGLSVQRMGYLGPNETTRFRVRFGPDAIAAFAGTLTFYTNDRNANPFVINLVGNGVAGTASDYESGDDRDPQVGTPGAPWIPANFDSAPFDAAESIGNFSGNLNADGVVVAQQVGLGTVKVSASGAFSAALKIGKDTGKVAGIINSDGSVTDPSFSGKLAAKYSLGALTLVKNNNGSGNYAIAGTLTPTGSSGNDVSFLFGHNKYSKTNPTALAGRYTMVIPANEDLGAGYPSGDSVALVTVKADGGISAAVVMADGERTGIRGRLTDEDIWQIYAAWKTATLGGQVLFQNLPEVSDFDGTVRWDRPTNAKAKNFHEGFSIELPALGSLYVPPPLGTRMVGGLADAADNAVFLVDGIDPPIGERTATWSALNKVTVIPGAGEKIGVKATSKTGSVTGAVARTYDDGGVVRKQTIKCTGVVFQKQNLVTGSWQAGTKAGYYGVAAGPSP